MPNKNTKMMISLFRHSLSRPHHIRQPKRMRIIVETANLFFAHSKMGRLFLPFASIRIILIFTLNIQLQLSRYNVMINAASQGH